MTDSLSVHEVGAGVPMVLLPWFSLDGRVMSAAFEPVLSQVDGIRRHYVDLPGTGGSAPVAPSSDAVVESVLGLVETLDPPVLLAGCSYGGYVAAAVTRRRPDLVDALALVCNGIRIGVAERTVPKVPRQTPLAWPDADAVEPWLRDHLDVALGTSDVAVAQRVAGLVSGARYDEDYLTELRERGYPVSDENEPTAYHGPTLMLCGRQDRVGGYVDQFAAMERYPHGTYAVVAGAGHYLPFERPDAFSGLLGPWVTDLLGG